MLYGPHIAPGEPAAERKSFADLVLAGRLRHAVARLNPAIPSDAQDEGVRKVTRRSSPSIILDNRTFHRMLVDGVEVEYPRPDGTVRGGRVRLVDFADSARNDWVAINQITIIEFGKNRRTDVLVFLNGLPVEGLFEPSRFLPFLQHFVVFEEDGANIEKKIAGYHQFHAVNRAVSETVRATDAYGDKRVGVVWHTQGSGKSLTMAFYGGRIILDPAMENPTLVALTDRNDLDDQLFGTFSRCSELLRQAPVQAQDRADLRRLLQVASGGVVFTTIQKFFPEEKDRKSVV